MSDASNSDLIRLVLDRLGAIEAGIARLSTGQEALFAGQGALTVGQEALFAGQDSLRADVARLSAGQEALRAGQESLTAGQASLRSDFTRLSDRQDQLRIDLMARMDRLQDSITGIREDISVIAGITDTVRRTSDNTRDEMRLTTDTVTILEKRVRNLMQQVRDLRGDP